MTGVQWNKLTGQARLLKGQVAEDISAMLQNPASPSRSSSWLLVTSNIVTGSWESQAKRVSHQANGRPRARKWTGKTAYAASAGISLTTLSCCFWQKAWPGSTKLIVRSKMLATLHPLERCRALLYDGLQTTQEISAQVFLGLHQQNWWRSEKNTTFTSRPPQLSISTASTQSSRHEQ